jgi:Na+-driven multidrug efflux pump
MLSRSLISKEILRNSIPLIINILSYPLSAIFTLSILAKYFPEKCSLFIIATAIINIVTKFYESLLSGTRVLAAIKINDDINIRKAIFNNAIIISFSLSIILLSLVFVSYRTLVFFHFSDYYIELAKTVGCLAVGVPGSLLYSSCMLYLHAHKETRLLPILSWLTNIISIVFLIMSCETPSMSSFYTILVGFSLIKILFGILNFVMVPSYLKKRPNILFLKNFKFKNGMELMKFGVSHAFCNLLFTGSYLIFSLLLKSTAEPSLHVFQMQINLLNIMSVINMAITSSGCVNYSYINNKQPQLKKINFEQNLILNLSALIIMLSIIFILRASIVTGMGGIKNSIFLFDQTFYLFVAIYTADLVQTVLLQTMTYSKDYILPPIIKIICFCSISIPLAAILTIVYKLGLIGILISILSGSVCATLFILFRFKSKNLFIYYSNTQP